MMNYNFEEIQMLAKLIGYNYSIENAQINIKDRPYNLFSKNEIKKNHEFKIGENLGYLIDKIWLNSNSLTTITSNSFSPNTKWESLILCNNELLKVFNKKEVSYDKKEDIVIVEYINDDLIILGKGETEFIATYNAILKYLNT